MKICAFVLVVTFEQGPVDNDPMDGVGSNIKHGILRRVKSRHALNSLEDFPELEMKIISTISTVFYLSSHELMDKSEGIYIADTQERGDIEGSYT